MTPRPLRPEQLIRDTEQRDLKIMSGRPKEPVRYRYKAGGFYDVVKTRVKRHILEKHGFGGVDPAKASVNRFIKVRLRWRESGSEGEG